MDSNLIRFHSADHRLNEESEYIPLPTAKTIPDWYRNADKYGKNPTTNEPYLQNGEKIISFKGCPSVLDVMTTGYVLRTPCDIEFYEENGQVKRKIDPEYEKFCVPRPEMPQFHHPEGYYKDHFAWFPEWAIETPEGYSALYTHPLNRFELPFLTVSGIIDNDDVNLPGSMPFFVKEGFVGIIEAGTPFAQIIPFKRDDWKSDIINKPHDLFRGMKEAARQEYESGRYDKEGNPLGGMYKRDYRKKKKYL